MRCSVVEPWVGKEPERPPAPFVVGVGRSGTTLLRLMLDAHSQLAIPPETNFGPAREAFERAGLAAAIEAILSNGIWDDYGISAEEFRHRVADDGVKDLGDLLRTFYGLYAEQRGKPRWGDKSPYYLLGMRQIQSILPEARFIHLIRDGRDVALSTIEAWFGASDIEGAAEEWSRLLVRGRTQAPGLHHYTEIRYESLVLEPADTLRRLCEFLELEWEEGMLDYHLTAAGRLSAELGDAVAFGTSVSREERLAMWHHVGCPPQRSRVERWRREMSRADLRAFDRVAGETLEELGYR